MFRDRTPCPANVGTSRGFLKRKHFGSRIVAVGVAITCGCNPQTIRIDWRLVRAEEFFQPAPAPLGLARNVGRLPELTSGINETVSFRFTITPQVTEIPGPSLDVAPFVSDRGVTLPATVTIYRVHPSSPRSLSGWEVRYIAPSKRVARPWDTLVPWQAPIGGLTPIGPPGETMMFWADLHVPKGAAAGRYRSKLVLRSGQWPITEIPIGITVTPITLPDGTSPSLIAGLDHRALFSHHVRSGGLPYRSSLDDWRFDPQQVALDRVLDGTMRLLRRHGLTPVLPLLAPATTIGGDGRVVVDWSPFDAVVEPFLTGERFPDGTPLEVWPLPALPGQNPVSPGAPRTPVRDFLPVVADHFSANGWLDRAFLDTAPSTSRHGRMARYRSAFEWAAKSAPGSVRLASRMPPQDLTPFGWPDYDWDPSVAANADIWMPDPEFYDLRDMERERDAGRETWLAAGRPPFSGTVELGARAGDVLILPWQAAYLHAAAVHLGTVNEWPDGAALSSVTRPPSAHRSALLMPGRPFGLDAPVPTVRLKLLRRAMQDMSYRAMLVGRGLAHIADALTSALVVDAGSDARRTHIGDGRAIGWDGSSTAYDLAREIMRQELMDTMSNSRRRRQKSKQFADSIAWRRLMLQRRQPRIRAVGCRVQLAPPQADRFADVACTLTVENRLRIPLTTTLSTSPLPSGWTAEQETIRLESIEPGGIRNVTARFSAGGMPLHPYGSRPLVFDCAQQGRTSQAVPARVCFVQAALARNTPVIDGDLSEWEPGGTNRAGGFLLITDADEVVSSSRVASLQTSVMVQRDDRHLYFGFRCQGPGTETAVRGAGSRWVGNNIVYESMIPRGGELVELLLDPLNAGTRTPSDLYHLTVKPTGAWIAERGLRTQPPCCRRRPWPADAMIACHLAKDGWTVELRIPLDTFGDLAEDDTVWGMNLTRYDDVNDEFSTWSGAVGSAYDPMSLGNLYIPRSRP